MDIFGIFSGTEKPMTMLEYLDNSSFDELAEFDFANNRHHNIYHVEGKYFVPLLDCSLSELYHFCQENMVHPDDRATYAELMNPDTIEERLAKARQPGVLYAQLRYKLLDGQWRWSEQVLIGGKWHGLPPGLVRGYIFDIQNQKDRREGRGTSFPSNDARDEMTGLLREKEFFMKTRDKAEQKPDSCLIAMDLENFRLFNDWYGREAGDILLAKIGALLASVESDDTVAGYFGQDDFCVLMPYDKERINKLYQDVQNLAAQAGDSLSVGFMPAFGIALLEQNLPILDAYDRAALAARKIKGDFHNRIRVYQPSMLEQTEEEYRILSAFQNALKNNEIYFCLQPQCRVSSGRVVGAESLARWRKADGTRIPPDVFVPVLEKYGFVTDLDQFIWEGVCKWIRKWIDAGHTPLPISVNVSQVDIFTINVPEFLDQMTKKYNISKNLLKIEITESAYVADTTAVKEAVQTLREMGFLVLMDDFGSGYSSLNMLRKLNVDIIKLDAQFLRLNDVDSEKGIRILETIFNMTKTMALPVIVEGVEDERQVSFLADLGCRYIQGYHFYRPMEIADFESLISDERKIDTRGFSFKPNQQFHIREFLDQNIYTDNMLNNILGAAAFYEWDGNDNVDIVRFNEQFYHLVNEPNFGNRISGIQNFFHPNDRKEFYVLLAQAKEDRLNGASGLFGVYHENGDLGRFFLHLYYLEQNGDKSVFYGAMQEMTEMTNLQNQMKLISRFSSESIVFLRRQNNAWFSQVVVHGLENVICLSKEAFEEELNNGAFYNRIDEASREFLHKVINSQQKAHNFGHSLLIHNGCGNPVDIYVQVDIVDDEYSNVERILMFRTREHQDSLSSRR